MGWTWDGLLGLWYEMRVNGVLGPGYKLAQSAEVQMAPE